MNNLSLNEKYLVDKDGRRVGVFLSIQEYRSLITRLEELESFRAAREEINIVDQLLAESKSERRKEDTDDDLPNFRRRQGPGGMIVM